MKRDTTPADAIQRIFSLLSGVGALVILGNSFAWVFATAYFRSLGAAWLASQLTWSDRYQLSHEFLGFLAASFSITFALGIRMAAESREGDDRLGRWATYLGVLACLLVLAMQVAITVGWGYSWPLGFAALVLVSASAALGLAWAFQPMFFHDPTVLSVRLMLLLGGLILFGLMGTPWLYGSFAAQEVVAMPSEHLPLITFANAPPSEWRLLLMRDDHCYVAAFGPNTKPTLKVLKVIDTSSVSIAPDGVRQLEPTSQMPANNALEPAARPADSERRGSAR